ncbi:MAG: hypothetical protein AAFZ06_15245, partial [Pseudomonadota bacterium]
NVLGNYVLENWHGLNRELRPRAWWEKRSIQFHHDGGFSARRFVGDHVSHLADKTIRVELDDAIGADGRPAVGPLVLDQLAAAARFELVASEVTGADVLTEWRPIPAPNSE